MPRGRKDLGKDWDNKRILDPAELMKVYECVGSVGAVWDVLVAMGVYNPETSEPFTRQAIQMRLRKVPGYRKLAQENLHSRRGKKLIAMLKAAGALPETVTMPRVQQPTIS